MPPSGGTTTVPESHTRSRCAHMPAKPSASHTTSFNNSRAHPRDKHPQRKIEAMARPCSLKSARCGANAQASQVICGFWQRPCAVTIGARDNCDSEQGIMRHTEQAPVICDDSPRPRRQSLSNHACAANSCHLIDHMSQFFDISIQSASVVTCMIRTRC